MVGKSERRVRRRQDRRGCPKAARLLSTLYPLAPLVLALLVVQSRAFSAPQAPVWGQPVTGIKIKADVPFRLENFRSQIVQTEGQPLDRAKVDESLKNLYATGQFEQLDVEAEPAPGGVLLVFRGRARYFVGLIRVEGAPRHTSAAALASAARLRLGEPLSEDQLEAARNRMMSLLEQNAYYTPQIQSSITRHPENQEADVDFSVTAGVPALLSGIEFHDHAGPRPARLASIAGWKTGTQLTSVRLDQGLGRIRKALQKQGYLASSVGVDRRVYDPKTQTERLLVQVETGPRVKVRVQGAQISQGDLGRTLTVYREGTIDPIALVQGQRELESFFERKGYFGAQAKVQQQTAPDSSQVEITYTVTLGPQGQFDGYTFQGNHALSSGDLAAVVTIQPQGEGPLRRGNFNRDLLDSDVSALTNLYHDHGFLEARITPILNHNYDEPGHLFVTFNVQEGPQTVVRNLSLHGIDPALERQLAAGLLTRPGKPYSPERARRDRDSLLNYFEDRGYGQATVNSKVSAPSDHQVDAEYDVTPGPQQKIARIITLGNDHTRPGVIDKQLSFDPGEPLNESSLLESQQHLYDLGLFNQVQIATQDPQGRQTEKAVLISVEEAHRWTLGYGGGIDVQRLPSNQAAGAYRVSPRVSLELDRINVDGRPQTFSLRGHFSNLEKIGSTSYVIPRFLNHDNLTFRISGLIDQSRDVLTFNSRRQEVTVSLQKQYSAHSSLIARYSFRRVSVSNLEIQQQEIPLFSQPARVAMVGLSYANDHRDNPVDATHGSYSLADFGAASSRLGSEANFIRLSGQNSTYYPLRPYLVFARNTRIGMEVTYGKEVIPGGVPLPELFFLGGSDSHRGFALNQAGPRDPVTGFPIGGKALFLNQSELRFRLSQNRLGFVLFHDAGNTYSSINTLRLLKVSQSSPTDFDYTVHAAGLGVRYQTPIGPLRFDVGYAFNPPRFDQTVNNSVEVQQLSHVQFFLSIGQSF